jgi:hypothetical protein
MKQNHTAKANGVSEFNDLVNMSAADLQDWLQTSKSTGAGWQKNDGSNETVGHER